MNLLTLDSNAFCYKVFCCITGKHPSDNCIKTVELLGLYPDWKIFVLYINFVI